MFEIALARGRTQELTVTGLTSLDGTLVTVASGDAVRMVFYRRAASTPIFDISTEDSATANGSLLSITNTVPTPAGESVELLLRLGEGDIEDFVPGAPLNVEINVIDASSTPSDAYTGPIYGFCHVLETSGAYPA